MEILIVVLWLVSLYILYNFLQSYISISSIELSFNTHPDYWRCGYTKEAIIEIMKFLFNNGYEKIICGYDEGNYKSKAIGELGFVLYEVKENAWVKNGVPITSYTSVLTKERFNELYNK